MSLPRSALALALALAACTSAKTPPAAGCPDDDALFRERVSTPLLQATCVTCHIAGGAAQKTRFVLKPGTDAATLKHNEGVFRAASALELNGEPLLLLKPTGRAPDGHGGGRVVEPGSRKEADLKLVVAWMRGEVPACRAPETISCDDPRGPRLLRRLTHDELRNTVRDLTGLTSDQIASFATDEVIGGFRNNAHALDVGPLLADQYRTAAEELGAAAATKLDALAPCHADGTAACVQTFVTTFGKRAFRRPLTAEELTRYRTLFAAAAADDGFAGGVRWVVTAMLQSPHFLYRSELGAKEADGSFALTPYEVATELSYLFLGTMPDAALFAAADTGALATPEGLKTQVLRLSLDPRASATLVQFVDQWLVLDRLPNVPRDAVTYPDLTPAVRGAMAGEIHRVVADLVAGKKTLADALDGKQTFVTDALADYYGLPHGTGPADAEGFKRVDLTGTPYGGLLTLGGLLTTYALPSGSSPIHRGKLVRERFLCQDLPPPPSNLNTSPPAVDPSLSTRERYGAHAKQPQCATCHQLMDPIGFAFEHFDGAGRYRLMDGTHAIDDSGEIVQSTASDGTFHGVQELGARLAASPDVAACYTRQWTTYAAGVDGEGLSCALRRKLPVSPDFETIRDTLTQLAHFTARTGEADEQDAPGAHPEPLPAPDPGTVATPPGPGGVSLTFEDQSRWTTGACLDAHVHNGTGAAVEWDVVADPGGAITNVWDATASPGPGGVHFTGVAWNHALAAGATADFGFCVSF
jgi:hypothetical protein